MCHHINMQKELFVRSLSFDTDDNGLHDYFAEVGNVESAKVITHRDTGRSRGFGFVTMATPEEAQKAIDELDGTELDGRQIYIDFAKPREERPRRDSRNDY
jgi:cold-inducible RNA-binding protein